MPTAQTPEDQERNNLFQSMLNFFKNTFNWMERKEERDEEMHQERSAILTGITDVFQETRRQGAELVSGISQTVQSNFEVRSLIQSQLGPLTPLVEDISGRLKRFGAAIITKLGGFFKDWKFAKIREFKFMKFMREDVWGRISKGWTAILGALLFLPVVFTEFLKEGPIKFARIVGRGLSSILRPPLDILGKVVGSLVKFLGRPLLSFKPIASVVSFFDKFKDITGRRAEPIVKTFRKIFGFLGRISKLDIPGLGLARGIGKILGKIFFPIQILLSIFDFFRGWEFAGEEAKLKDKIISGVSGIISGFIKPFVMLFDWVLGKIGIDSELASFINIENVSGIIGGAVDGIISAFRGIINAVTFVFDKFKLLWDDVTGLVNRVVNMWGFEDFQIPSADMIIESIGGFTDRIVSGIKSLFSKETWSEMFEESKSNFMDNMKGVVKAIFEPFMFFFDPERIKNAILSIIPEPLKRLAKLVGIDIPEATPIDKNVQVTREIRVRQPETVSVKEVVEGQKGGLIVKTGIIKAHEGEIITPVEKIAPIIKSTMTDSSGTRRIVEKVVESNEKLQQNISRVAEATPERQVLPPAPTNVGLTNIPMMVEDTGLILVTSGVL